MFFFGDKGSFAKNRKGERDEEKQGRTLNLTPCRTLNETHEAGCPYYW